MLSDEFESRPRCVLIADANAHARTRLASALRDAGRRVVTASDGDEALAKAYLERPEIVFLDSQLPNQDGWLVCAKLKLNGDALTVVMMIDRAGETIVGDSSRPDRFAAFVQADELLRKPFDVAEALRLVRGRALSV